MQSILVRFMTFRYRTLFYTNRKKIKYGARVRLDLTRDHYNLLVSGRKSVNNYSDVYCAYADINCKLVVKLADESHTFFESMEELNGILSKASE